MKRGIFKNRDFMLLWLGQLVSLFGDRMHAIAAMWYVLKETGSPLKMGTTLVFSVVPTVVLGPIAGVVADKYSRKMIIVVCDLVNGLLVGVLYLLLITGNLELWMLYLITCLISVSSTFFRPAVTASVPSIVADENLIQANSMMQLCQNGSGLFGPVIGGILIGFFGVPALFVINSISYLLSACSEAFMRIPLVLGESKRITLNNLKRSIGFVISHKDLLHFIIVGGFIINFFLAPLSIFIPIFTERVLLLGSGEYGLLMSSIAAGSTIMTLLAPLANKKLDCYTLAFLGLVGEGVSLVLFSQTTGLYTSVLALVLLGAAIAICNIALSTVFQRLIPNNLMGRITGIFGAISMATIPLGYFLGGLLSESLSVNYLMLVSGIVVASAGATTMRTAKMARERGKPAQA